MRQFMAVARALADESRVRVLLALRGRELCVCQIIELLGLAPSTVSKHMSILKQAYLVDSRKEGRWIHYRLPSRDAPVAVKEAILWLTHALADNDSILADAKRIESIERMDKEKLCAGRRC